jgi:hypothetical protein
MDGNGTREQLMNDETTFALRHDDDYLTDCNDQTAELLPTTIIHSICNFIRE